MKKVKDESCTIKIFKKVSPEKNRRTTRSVSKASCPMQNLRSGLQVSQPKVLTEINGIKPAEVNNNGQEEKNGKEKIYIVLDDSDDEKPKQSTSLAAKSNEKEATSCHPPKATARKEAEVKKIPASKESHTKGKECAAQPKKKKKKNEAEVEVETKENPKGIVGGRESKKKQDAVGTDSTNGGTEQETKSEKESTAADGKENEADTKENPKEIVIGRESKKKKKKDATGTDSTKGGTEQKKRKRERESSGKEKKNEGDGDTSGHTFKIYRLKVPRPVDSSKEIEGKEREEEIELPAGEKLLVVGDIDLPQEAVGPALQFLEFCSAFKKLLDLKKGQSEAILRELVRNVSLRRGAHSQLVQLHVKLLRYIYEDTEDEYHITCALGKDSWLRAFKTHILQKLAALQSTLSKSESTVDSPEAYRINGEDLSTLEHAINDVDVDSYSAIDVHQKLQLLNFICDDCLSTRRFRGYLEKAVANHEDKQREVREEVLAAKKEAKAAVQKKKDIEAERIIAVENGNDEQQSSLLNKIRLEYQKVCAAKMAVAKVVNKTTKLERLDALRTEAIVVGSDGRAFWKLKGANDRSVVVIQGRGGEREEWQSYNEDEEKVLVEFVNMKKRRKQDMVRRQRHCWTVQST